MSEGFLLYATFFDIPSSTSATSVASQIESRRRFLHIRTTTAIERRRRSAIPVAVRPPMRLAFAKSLKPVVVGLPVGLPVGLSVDFVGEGVVGELVEKEVGVLVVGADFGSKKIGRRGFVV